MLKLILKLNGGIFVNIDIIAVGKVKEKYFRDAIREYRKRLSPFCKLNIIEVRDEKAPENLSDVQRNQILKKEGDRILAKIKPSNYVISLCIEGKEWSSEEMAKTIARLMVEGKSRITFIIGGSLGLCDEIKKKSDYLLSFSRLTFPHQLFRIIVLEQVYRSFKIIRNEPYHK